MSRGSLLRQSSLAGAAGSSKSRVGGAELERKLELLYLAHEGDAAEIEALLSRGIADVNFSDFDDRTALHIAACEGNVDVVSLLLRKGANVNAQDRWGSTPLADAQHYHNEDVCKLLTQHGAKSKAQGSLVLPEFEVNPAELEYSGITLTKKGYQVATWRGTRVFVKCFKHTKYSERELMGFRSELLLIQKLRHPNIVQFLGAVTQSSPVMIIFEYLPQGDLYQFLKGKGALKPSNAIDFALDIARGLNFMHEHKPEPIVHRDLKPKNILRDESGHLKVADFGLSKMLQFAAHTISEDGLPPLKGSSCRYMAPEVFKHRAYGREVDVFAFGLIVQEMVEGVPPMWHMENEKVPSAYADENLRPAFNASHRNYPGDLKKLIEECWDKDPGKRPTFGNIIDRLERIQAKQQKSIWKFASWLTRH